MFSVVIDTAADSKYFPYLRRSGLDYLLRKRLKPDGDLDLEL
jgi:hypothetical protein